MGISDAGRFWGAFSRFISSSYKDVISTSDCIRRGCKPVPLGRVAWESCKLISLARLLSTNIRARLILSRAVHWLVLDKPLELIHHLISLAVGILSIHYSVLGEVNLAKSSPRENKVHQADENVSGISVVVSGPGRLEDANDLALVLDPA